MDIWIDHIFTTGSATRMMQCGLIFNETARLNKIDSLKDGMDEKAHESPNYFLMTFDSWGSNEVDDKPRIDQELNCLKEKADKLAAEKKHEEAISHYDMITIQSLGEPSLINQASTNCAALRLRICTESPRQILAAMFDCTMALEIDPNNVEALFRRGLGLALIKKWNEAIVDFERALELDPNSPVKKELKVARRQVTLRIGN